jgi:hypothetical protein
MKTLAPTLGHLRSGHLRSGNLEEQLLTKTLAPTLAQLLTKTLAPTL